ERTRRLEMFLGRVFLIGNWFLLRRSGNDKRKKQDPRQTGDNDRPLIVELHRLALATNLVCVSLLRLLRASAYGRLPSPYEHDLVSPNVRMPRLTDSATGSHREQASLPAQEHSWLH